MERDRLIHCLAVLRDDLGRESLEVLKHELEQIVEMQKKSIDLHGSYLTTTRDDELPKLKTAAILNKARMEAAQHLLAFFSKDYLDKAIDQLKEDRKEEEMKDAARGS